MNNRENYCNIDVYIYTNLVLLCLGLSEVAQNLHNRQGDDPNLCTALDLTYNFVGYSYDLHLATGAASFGGNTIPCNDAPE